MLHALEEPGWLWRKSCSGCSTNSTRCRFASGTSAAPDGMGGGTGAMGGGAGPGAAEGASGHVAGCLALSSDDVHNLMITLAFSSLHM